MKAEVMLMAPQVAERLGMTTARVRQFILEGRLPSAQDGRDHIVKESDLELVADRKPGRPVKQPAPKPTPPDNRKTVKPVASKKSTKKKPEK